jgi:hypothetical protein
MNYKAYPTSKTTPSRRARKGERNAIFQYNKTAARKAAKARRDARHQEEENAD